MKSRQNGNSCAVFHYPALEDQSCFLRPFPHIHRYILIFKQTDLEILIIPKDSRVQCHHFFCFLVLHSTNGKHFHSPSSHFPTFVLLLLALDLDFSHSQCPYMPISNYRRNSPECHKDMAACSIIFNNFQNRKTQRQPCNHRVGSTKFGKIALHYDRHTCMWALVLLVLKALFDSIMRLIQDVSRNLPIYNNGFIIQIMIMVICTII